MSEKTQNSVNSGTDRPQRIVSVDVLRGLTILLMVFVNDLGPAAPAWMLHIQPSDADGMTLADIVFPFFLFIVGVSLPLAVETARRRGQSYSTIFLHVLQRTGGLLLMGLVGVNRAAITSLSPALWGLLCYLCILCTWCVGPKTAGRRRTILLTLRAAGLTGLIVLFAVYRRDPVTTTVAFRGEVQDWTWLQTQWWGILGLIGWAYLTAGVIYLLIGKRREWLAMAGGLLMANFVVAGLGGFFVRLDDKPWLTPLRPVPDVLRTAVEYVDQYVSLGSQLGSLPAVVICGVLLGTILKQDSDVAPGGDRIRWALGYATLLFLAGAMTDAVAGVNKIAATPTWCFWCSSLAVLTWAVLYAIIDMRQWTVWAKPVVSAGANPLIAYLMHPILLSVMSLTGTGGTIRSYASSRSAAAAICGSLVMAFVVCGLTTAIARAGFRVRIERWVLAETCPIAPTVGWLLRQHRHVGQTGRVDDGPLRLLCEAAAVNLRSSRRPPFDRQTKRCPTNPTTPPNRMI
ncbi:MAG: DUF5009 domain-containing protein [Planctomycetaceae bacterium]|nr:DUF5009 domain-containing protein [Planctomycetaceae bacterium]